MRTVLTTEHLGARYFFEDPDENVVDVRPDLEIARLTELVRAD
jgi:hypothetical protein